MSKKKIGILIVAVIAIASGLIWLARPNSAPLTSHTGQLSVVAGENFWGDIAGQIGGNYVHVTSIITDPNADPHLYESSAQDAAAVTSADIVVVNGLGYDDFMDKLLGASPSNDRQVLKVADLLNAPEGANQHLWYDIPRVDEVAAKIASMYSQKDPSHASDYEHNLEAFDGSLTPLLNEIGQIRRQYATTPVAYTEPVPGYLLADLGLSVKTPEGFAKAIEDGTDPAPADTNAMDALMQNKAVKVLLYNAQATSPVTEQVKILASQANIPVIGVTETMPTTEKNYQSWQQDQLNALLEALKVK